MDNRDSQPIDEMEIFKQGELCIQEEQPWCSNACPLGVDVRALLGSISQGNFEQAWKDYRKKAVFPEILSRICDAPCTGKCIRRDIDQPLNIQLLERACAEHGDNAPAKKVFIRPKDKAVNIIGSGLASLSCAHTLANKGYNVNIYERADRLGGKLWQEEGLPADVIKAELASLTVMQNICVHLGYDVRSICGLPGDITFVATGEGGESFGVDVACVDPLLPYDEGSGLFFGGGLLGEGSPVKSIAMGKRVASQMETLLKGVKPQSHVTKAETKLYTPAKDKAEPRDAIQPINGAYTREQAIEEASRCLQCECLACLPGCRLLRDNKAYPKVYVSHAQQSLRTIKLVQKKLVPRRTTACNLCGLCKELCPNNLDMSEVYMQSRRLMHRNDELPPAFYDFWLRDMEFSASEDVSLCRQQPGCEQTEYMFFPGCQLGGSRQEYVTDTYAYLRDRLEGGVALCLDCCGAPSEWAGYVERTTEAVESFRRHWLEMGKPKVILACPSCEKMFGRYHADVETISLWSVFAEQGLPESAANVAGRAAAIFDPCSSRYNPGEQQAIRAMAAQMGFKCSELEFHGNLAKCCGYGGLIYASNPELFDAVVGDNISESELPYITYCVNCRDEFAKAGKSVWYMLDLLFGRDELTGAVSLSERRENRVALKRRLLKEIWGEDWMAERQEYMAIELRVSDEMQRKLDRKLILQDEIRQLIHQAEQSGEKIVNGAGNFVTGRQIGHIVYWAEYRSIGDEYELVNAYTHRMIIKRK